MGNRAVITTRENFDNNGVGVYVHWNGGRDSVEAFLTYCKRKGYRSPDRDCYGVITKEIMALYEAFHVINKGKRTEELKGRIFISKAVILLCQTKHNRDADILSNYVYDKKYDMTDEEIEKLFREIRANRNVAIPEYVYDVHTIKGKIAGKTKSDFFREEEKSLANKQMSIFDFVQKGEL